MNRRDFLQKLSIATGGILLASQVELIEKLTPKNYVGGFNLYKIPLSPNVQLEYKLVNGLFQIQHMTDHGKIVKLESDELHGLSKDLAKYLYK